MLKVVIPGLLATVLVAIALRCPELGGRPMHNDEAVNAVKFRSLWEQGSYRYDPNEHHGPSLLYFTMAWSKLTRAPDFVHFDEARLRRITVLFGVGLILLLPLVADGLGRGATVWAGLFTAVSPAMVYYSRDYIHETVLVFFTFLAVASGWRYFRSRKIAWALLAGAAVGLMQSTKETFVLALIAMTAGLILNGLWEGRLEAAASPAPFKLRIGHVLAAIVVWGVIVVIFFSSFLTNASGPLDAVRTYFPWVHRAAGDSPHVHPWTFYLARLAFFHAGKGPIWSEALILALAAVGIIVALARKGPRDSHSGFLRFLALYAPTLLLLYNFIPYKTPWCVLSCLHGMILLAGVGAVAILQRVPGRRMKFAIAMLLLAVTAQLAVQARRASMTYAADPGNPYVYAQTSPDILELVDEVEALARANPEGHHLLVKVMAPGDDYWPLPWYLRGFDQTGWWSEVPADPFAPVMIVSAQFKATLDTKGTHVLAGMFQLRPGIFLELYVQSDLWRAYLETKSNTKSYPFIRNHETH